MARRVSSGAGSSASVVGQGTPMISSLVGMPGAGVTVSLDTAVGKASLPARSEILAFFRSVICSDHERRRRRQRSPRYHCASLVEPMWRQWPCGRVPRERRSELRADVAARASQPPGTPCARALQYLLRRGKATAVAMVGVRQTCGPAPRSRQQAGGAARRGEARRFAGAVGLRRQARRIVHWGMRTSGKYVPGIFQGCWNMLPVPELFQWSWNRVRVPELFQRSWKKASFPELFQRPNVIVGVSKCDEPKCQVECSKELLPVQRQEPRDEGASKLWAACRGTSPVCQASGCFIRVFWPTCIFPTPMHERWNIAGTYTFPRAVETLEKLPVPGPLETTLETHFQRRALSWSVLGGGALQKARAVASNGGGWCWWWQVSHEAEQESINSSVGRLARRPSAAKVGQSNNVPTGRRATPTGSESAQRLYLPRQPASPSASQPICQPVNLAEFLPLSQANPAIPQGALDRRRRSRTDEAVDASLAFDSGVVRSGQLRCRCV
ncbi:uncharacterized protein PSFLO_03792 [Pseudozyma flocculosa]|uniref:Uncharacterized protein n=1 Tax=Pseudozyma flocculosa TaxID=84751 RepID=A0A5C3F2W3_9BASI|nr:uncharacterized protein PSFLO_03792 [Pseudozyma flocculosa]